MPFFFNLQPLENLKVMNLRSSSKLSLSDSDLSKFPNLEVLNLGQCSGLAGLPSSIKNSTRLTELILYLPLLNTAPDLLNWSFTIVIVYLLCHHQLYRRRLKVCLLSSDRIFECLWSLWASLYKKAKANRWCIKFYWCITGSLNWFNKQIKTQLWYTSYVLSLICSCIDSAVSWRCLTIVQPR